MSYFIYPCYNNITSGFRPPNRPNHNGIDFSRGINEPIYASAGGVVSRSYVSESYGEVIFIKHNIQGQSYETVYAHMMTGSRLVFEGNTVTQGQQIGTMGNTGDSTGTHLHFELCIPEWVQGGANAVDPLPYLEGEGGGGAEIVCKNDYLTQSEMTGNAQYIANAFINEGWTRNAISGMLGNMQVESTINPCLWQNRDSGNVNLGFGLVQWTPSTVLIDWANSIGLDYSHIDTQIQRILFELQTGLQYYPTSEYPLSFKEFTQSNESPEYLASAFLKNYERAGIEKETDRRNNARYWFNTLNWEGGDNPSPPESVDNDYIQLLLCGAVNGWQY